MGGVGRMTHTSNNYLLHMEDVYKRYINHKGVEFTVLNDIDLKVRNGEFICLVGPSGCGKSTLFRLILGSEQPSEGRILYNGQPIKSPDRHRGIVFQKYSLFPHLTVLENLIFGLDMEEFTIPARMLNPFRLHRRRKEFRDKAEHYLERVGLANEGDKYPQQLSGGMRQRVAIAQSLIMEPSILLMDEPFGALDDSTRQDMQLFILEQWKKSEMTVFFVTHDLEEAVFLSTRSLVLSQYYDTDKNQNEGSKIVTDIPIPVPHPRSTDFKYSEEMAQWIKKLRNEGLDPESRRHIKDFDLSHRDSWRTVKDEEWHNKDLDNPETMV
jgi:NitT/TauT family transport system ATP-binding protein